MNSLASLVLQVNATSVNAATTSLNQLAAAGAQAQSATTNLTSSTNQANSSILANQQAWFSNTAAINSSTQAMSHLANGFKSAFFGASIAVGLIELKNHLINLTDSLIQAQVQVDKLRNSLNFAVGKGAAVGDLAFIKKSAQDMGLSFVTVTEQYTRLAAASRQTSLEGQKTKDIFTSISQASTVLGLSADETTGALRAITQMISKNTVMSEELKGQLGERLPGAFQIAARAMGVTTQELNKMLETGKVLAEDFLPKFAAQLLKETAPDIGAASQSMQASLNRLETAWTLFKQAVVKSGLGQSMSNEISGLGSYLATLSESMDRARDSGSGLSGQLMTGLGTALARMPFDVVNTSANLLNGTLNLLGAGALNLSTNVNILPKMFETSAYASSQLDGRLKEAEQDLSQLQAKLAVVPDNIYLKSEAYQAYLLVQQLRDAKELQAQLKGEALVGGGRGAVNPSTIGQMEEAAVKAQQKIDTLMAKSSSVPDAYIKRAKEIAEANKDGAMTAQQLAVALGTLHSLLPKVSSAHTKLSEAQKLVNAGEKTYGDILAKDTGYAANFTETILAMVAARDKNSWSAEKYNEVVNAYLAKQPGAINLAKEQVKAFEDQAKATDKATDAYIKMLDAREMANADTDQVGIDYEKATRGMQEYADLEASLMGQGALARDDALAQYKTQLELETKILEIKKAGGSQATIDANIAIVTTSATSRAAVESQKKYVAEWNKTYDRIETDLVASLLKGGKEGAEGIRDLLVRELVSKPFEIVVKTLLQPVTQGLTNMAMGAMGMTGGASGGSSVMGAVNTASGLNSLYSLATTSYAGMVGSATTTLLGQTAANAAMGTVLTGSTSAASAAAVAAAEAAGISAEAAAVMAAQGTTVGGAASAAWVAAPYVAAALVVANGLGLFKNTERVDGGVVTTLGANSQQQAYDLMREDGSLFDGPDYWEEYKPVDTAASAELQKQTDQIKANVISMGDSLGLAASDTSDFSTRLDFRTNGLDAAAIQKKIDEGILAFGEGAVDAAFGTALDAYAKVDETTGATLERLSISLLSVNAIFEDLGQGLLATSLDGAAAASALADFSGGMAQLTTNAQTYFANFYSAEEQRALAVKDINAATAGSGLDAATATRDTFRELVESWGTAASLATVEGQKTYAALLGVSGAMGELVTASEAAATALASTNKKWQDQLDTLTGAETDRSIALRDATDDSTRALMNQVYAQEDLTAAATLAAEAARAIAEERAGLESSLMQALGDTAGLRALEISALDESNRALQEHIWAIEDVKAAYEASKTTAQSALSKLQESVNAEKTALDKQLDADKQAIADKYKLQTDANTAQVDAARTAADAIRGIASALANAVKAVQIDSPATNYASLQSARSLISTADPLTVGLEDALSTASQDSKQYYGNFEDYAFAQAVTASDIQRLNTQAQSQLTVSDAIVLGLSAQSDVNKLLSDAETLAAQALHDAEVLKLDAAYTQGESQLNALLGIDTRVLSVAEAVAALNVAIAGLAAAQNAQAQATAAASAASAAARSYVPPSAAAATPYVESAPGLAPAGTASNSYVRDLLTQAMAGSTTVDGQLLQNTAQASADAYNSGAENYNYSGYLSGVDYLQVVYDSAARAGMTQTQLDGVLGYAPGTVEQWAIDRNMPAFEQGINYVPNDMLAQIHEGEAVVPKAYNPFNPANNSTNQGNAELVAELKAIRAELAAIKASSNATAGHTAGTDRKLARVIKNDAIATEAVAA